MPVRVNRPGRGSKAFVGDDLTAVRASKAAGKGDGIPGHDEIDVGDRAPEKGIPHRAARHIGPQAELRGVFGHAMDRLALFGAGAVEQAGRVHKSGL